MNIEEKIAQTEAEIYLTVQALGWLSENIGASTVDLDELRVSLDLVSVSARTSETLAQWGQIDAIGDARHAAGNNGIYTFSTEGGTLGYVFVRCPEFLKWDERRKVNERGLDYWPTRSLRDDLEAFQSSPVSQEVGR